MKKFLATLAGGMIAALAGINAAAADPMKVGFVYLTNPGDHGWTYAHEVARQDIEAHFGDKVVTSYVENVPEGPDAARVIREGRLERLDGPHRVSLEFRVHRCHLT